MTDLLAIPLIERLLDLYEAKPDRVKSPSINFPDKINGNFIASEIEDKLLRQLRKYEDSGAIIVRYGSKETAHRPKSVVLRDADVAYCQLGREHVDQIHHKLEVSVRSALGSVSGELEALLYQLFEKWRKKARFLNIRPLDVDTLIAFMQCVKAIRSVPESPPDMRTYSRHVLGASKLIENNMSRLRQYLIEADELPEEMTEQEVLAHYGLEKFQHPVLVAGAFLVGGAPLPVQPYIGVPWEALKDIECREDVTAVVTIENFASFNRFVREVPLNQSIAVYTGGFPSKSVQALLSLLREKLESCRCYHWGDIDPSGLHIANVCFAGLEGQFPVMANE